MANKRIIDFINRCMDKAWPKFVVLNDNKNDTKPQKMKHGIDISHHQGKIDWNKVKATGKVDFVIIKATQGVGYTDPKVQTYSQEAKKAGIPIGYYHFASLNNKDEENDAKAEANWFDKVLQTLPNSTLPVVLDIEENKADLTPDEVLNWINAFVSEMKRLGYEKVILYSYTPFLDQNLPKNHSLGDMDLWIAQYRDVEKPKLPNGWDGCILWQYSCTGKIEGINANVDLNKVM